jgi:hypothetical protein
MKTQILLPWKPYRNYLVDADNDNPVSITQGPYGGIQLPYGQTFERGYNSEENTNYSNTKSFLQNVRSGETLALDLYEDIEIPLNFTILDIRQPEKRKTNFSKTILLPGTKNNNRIFNHIYEIGSDTTFNPNIRKEALILQDGVQIMRGSLQLVKINKLTDGSFQYEILIQGDFSSLFNDIGISKINDLDFREWEHPWTITSIANSWDGLCYNNGQLISTHDVGTTRNFTSVLYQQSTSRVRIQTTSSHGFNEGDWIRLEATGDRAHLITGDYQVAERISSTQFTINYPFPEGLLGNSTGGTVKKFEPKGVGYTYPLISWGDEIGGNKFQVETMTPAFYIKEIWDKIFKMTGSRYQSNFLNSDYFKHLVLTQKLKGFTIPSSVLQERKFKVANIEQPTLRVVGFGTQQSGEYNTGERSFPQNTNYIQPYPFTASIPASDGLLFNGTEDYNPFNQSSNKWTVNETGRYGINVKISYDAIAEVGNWSKAVPDNGAGFSSDTPIDSPDYKYFFGLSNPRSDIFLNVRINLVLFRQGVKTILTSNYGSVRGILTGGEFTKKLDFKTFESILKTVELKIESQYLNKDDQLWVEMSYNLSSVNAQRGMFTEYYYFNGFPTPGITVRTFRGTLDLRIKGVSLFLNNPSDIIKEGDKIYPQQFMPKDMKCSDFVLGIIKAFNLHVESDKEIDKFYYIEPRDDYYKDGSSSSDFVDWTDKLETDEYNLVPMSELTAKFYNFKYVTENDHWSSKYKKDTGREWGDWTRIVQNDFISKEENIQLPFATTPMINYNSFDRFVIPQVVQRDEIGVNKPTNSKPKLLFWSGLRPLDSTLSKSWSLVSTIVPENQTTGIELVRQRYPYAGTVDSPFDPIHDLTWFYTDYVFWNRARWTNENLYNKYWRRFIEEITDKDSKLLIGKFKLNAKDINNIDFKKIYVVNGHWLRLQKIIDYNANGNSLTTVQLLKLKSPSKFGRISAVINAEFVDLVYDNSNPIPVVDIYTPPQNPDLNPGGWVSDTFTGTLPGIVNGINNTISGDVSGVYISGKENIIGSDCKNITIMSNAVNVTSGVSNVNVIGTDNIVVSESDVTYINGVKYKNGVAISRANVIDGGLNKVIDATGANTVANVVEGGEDISISTSSSTYENIINCGQDSILPDVPDYGISTVITPLPETNAIGSYEILLTTRNLSEIITETDVPTYQER